MIVDRGLVIIAIVTLAGYLWLATFHPEGAVKSLDQTAEMFKQAVPWIIVSMFAAGLLGRFLQPAVVAQWLGRTSGAHGVILGALLGLFGTGSRWAMYPLAAGLFAADAGTGAIFSFVTSWQLVSLTRIPAEVPFYGVRFTVERAVVSLLVAVLGGLFIHWFETPRGH